MISNDELTLLSEEEIWGVNGSKQLDVLQKYGTKSAITDLAILTGDVFNTCNYKVPDDRSLKGRIGWYYTRSSDGDGEVCGVNGVGFSCNENRFTRHGAVRPVLHSSEIFNQISSNRVSGYRGTEEVEYGEYPQYAPDKNIQNELEREYERGLLRTTGRTYTFDKTEYYNYDQYFQPVTYEEYEYKEKNIFVLMQILLMESGYLNFQMEKDTKMEIKYG